MAIQGVGTNLLALGVGIILMEAYIDTKWGAFDLKDILHIEGSWNFFSEIKYLTLLKASHFGWYIKRNLTNAEFINDVTRAVGPTAVREESHDEAQFMLFRPQQTGILMALQQPLPGTNTSIFWHERFGHVPIGKNS